MDEQKIHRWRVPISKIDLPAAWSKLFTTEFETRFNKSQGHDIVELSDPVKSDKHVIRSSKIILMSSIIPSVIRSVVGLFVELSFQRKLIRYEKPEDGVTFQITVPALGKEFVASGEVKLKDSQMEWMLIVGKLGKSVISSCILAVMSQEAIENKIVQEVKTSSQKMADFLIKE